MTKPNIKGIELSVAKFDVPLSKRYKRTEGYRFAKKLVHGKLEELWAGLGTYTDEEIFATMNYKAAAGLPYPYVGIKKKLDFFKDYERAAYDLYTGAKHGGAAHTFYKIAPKVEPKSTFDVANHKLRTFIVQNIVLFYWHKKIFGKQGDAITARWWWRYGFNPYGGGVDGLYKYLISQGVPKGWVRVFISGDISGFDRLFQLLKVIYKWRKKFVNFEQMVDWVVYNVVNHKIVNWNGDVLQFAWLNPSGSAQTTPDNMIGHSIIHADALHEIVGPDVERWCRPAIYSDDFITSVVVPKEKVPEIEGILREVYLKYDYKLDPLIITETIEEHTFLGFSFQEWRGNKIPMFDEGRIAYAVFNDTRPMLDSEYLSKLYTLYVMTALAPYSICMDIRGIFYAVLRVTKESGSVIKSFKAYGLPSSDEIFAFYMGYESGDEHVSELFSSQVMFDVAMEMDQEEVGIKNVNMNGKTPGNPNQTQTEKPQIKKQKFTRGTEQGTAKASRVLQSAPRNGKAKALGAPGSAVLRIAQRNAQSSRVTTHDRGDGRSFGKLDRTNTKTGKRKDSAGELVPRAARRLDNTGRRSGGAPVARSSRDVMRRELRNRLIKKLITGKGPGVHLVSLDEYHDRRRVIFGAGDMKERNTKLALKMGYPSAPSGGVGLAHSAAFASSEQYESCKIMSTTYVCSLSTGSAGGNASPPDGSLIEGTRVYACPINLDALNNSALQALKGMYAQAFCRQCIFTYMPNCPATTPGSLIIAVSNERDKVWRERGSGVNSIQEAYDCEQWVETQVWESAEVRVKFTDKKENAVYTSGFQGSFQDITIGDFEILSSSEWPKETDFGHVLVTMEWEFFDRVWNFPDALQSSHGYLEVNTTGYTAQQGLPIVLDGTQCTAQNFDFDSSGPHTAIYSVVVSEVTGDTFAYYINGMMEGESFTLEVGDRFFVTEIEADGAVYFQLFADGQGAYSPLTYENNVEATEPRGAIMCLSDATVDTHIVLDGIGYVL
jgi:hypothetical protein